MKEFSEMEFNPTSEQLVKILCNKTQNNNPAFYRIMVAYYFSLVASMMRVTIKTHDRGDIPVNMYALNLSTSGSGKGFSTNILENQVIHLFKQEFLTATLKIQAETNLQKLAKYRAIVANTEEEAELSKLKKEYESLGPLVFSFDSGTPPAIKQMRNKLLMANAGSLNLQIDEIGSNLISNIDVLNTFLELYDMGFIKQKLIKNTAENTRIEEVEGNTPTNMLLFGTPSKLLNGAKTEEEFNSMLETGYARRCFFGFNKESLGILEMTPQQIYDSLTDDSSNEYIRQLSQHLGVLGNVININRKLSMSKATSLILIEYRLKCEKEASLLNEHEEIKKAELSHRYFKSLKLAGAYAFIEDSHELTDEHLYQAIKLAEESGNSFTKLLNRDRTYVRLAKYLGNIGKSVTQVDLTEDLPFYKGTVSQKNEMLTLAIAWGYRNSIIIKKSYNDNIEFLQGETLKKTNLSEIIVSYSRNMAYDYINKRVPFDALSGLVNLQDRHWVNHHVINGHRSEDTCIPGFNLVVLDVDGGISIDSVKLLLNKYQYLLHPTKSHKDYPAIANRFRVLLPITYELKLDSKDYKEFMGNVMEWLPFDIDSQTHRAKKWATHDGLFLDTASGNKLAFEYNSQGQLLDPLQFIPQTSKNEEFKATLNSQQSLNTLERWFVNETKEGNRNNMIFRYGMMLKSNGYDFDTISSKIKDFNQKLPHGLTMEEINSQIMVSIAKSFSKP